ncbi:MAG: T9SS type A sorting domain-containing protein [Flavobacteriales bacterium]
MELWNAAGQQVWSGNWQTGKSLSLQDFASGVYTLRYIDGQHTGVHRVIKN